MSDQDPQMPVGPDGNPMTEEQLAAAYEEQIKQLRVEDVLLQTVVSLLNLGGRKAGLAPGTEDERDLNQLALTIEGVRRLLPLVEEALGPDAAQLKEAVSQLQMAYVQLGGQAPAGAENAAGAASQPATPESPVTPPGGGRLWVPGQ
ncbi:MAG: hypothetical protein JWO02_3628 [Solirubrobacterales bacterium]|nr:hypothetical protein [Solirubrobacterales bacterium]